jgi:hypothetical protein
MNSLALILIMLGFVLIIFNYKETRKYVDTLININKKVEPSKKEHFNDNSNIIGINLSTTNLQLTDISNLS